MIPQPSKQLKPVTEEAVEKQNKLHAYINAARAASGDAPIELQQVITDEQVTNCLNGAEEMLIKVSFALKKTDPTDLKALTKRLEELKTKHAERKTKNEAMLEDIKQFYKDIDEHPAAKKLKERQVKSEGLLAEFAKNHKIVMFGGKTCIRREDKHDWVVPEQLRTYFSHIDIPGDDGRPKNIVNAFLDWDRAPRYADVLFNPARVGHYDGHYNLWQGFQVEPEAGDDDALWWDILAAACGYNEDYLDYVSKWFADIFQNPARKPGTAIGIVGKQGIGKSALVETVGALLSNLLDEHADGTITGAYGDFTLDELLADFNEHITNKLLIYLDEATWGGSHANAQRMKKVITKTYETINPKFLGRITLPCYRREVFSSNNDFYYRPDKDDRRLLPLEFDTSQINDMTVDFWREFYDKRSNGKMLANLLFNLQQIDLTGWHPQSALKALTITTGQSMLNNSKEQWEHWLEEVADSATLTIEERDGTIQTISIADEFVADSKYEDAFLSWSRKHRCETKWHADGFKKQRTIVFGERVRKMENGLSQYMRKAPTREQMIAKLAEQTRWKTKEQS